MFWFGNRNTQSKPCYTRETGKLYYKDNPLAANKTPRQLIVGFPELSSYLPMLVLYGMADVTIENIIKKNGLARVQSFIDKITR